jgi:tripartite-type tricarboxylate transporter receptor subunit TctC
MPLVALLGSNSNVRFDPLGFTWLGSASDFGNDAYVLIARKDAPVGSIADMLRPDGAPMVLGGTAEGGGSSDVPKILRDALGLKIKLIAGYRDSAAIYLAMERGEVSGRTTELSSIKATRPNWFGRDGNFKILLQYARATRLSELRDVPTARELAQDEKTRALIELTEAPFGMAWPYAAPPGIPADRAGALQAAFIAAHQDPQLRAEAAGSGIDINPVGAQTLRRRIENLARMPPEMFDRVRKILTTGKDG